MYPSIALAALAVVAPVLGDDVLHSRRMAKRFIDDEGNFNMCECRRLNCLHVVALSDVSQP